MSTTLSPVGHLYGSSAYWNPPCIVERPGQSNPQSLEARLHKTQRCSTKRQVKGEAYEGKTQDICVHRDRNVFATASFAQQVKTDYDRNANFSQYKTYSWEKVQTQDPLWIDRIKDAVNVASDSEGLDAGRNRVVRSRS